MNIVIIRGSVIYKKVKYCPGEVLSVDEAEGQRLIKLGVALSAADNTVISNPPEPTGEANPAAPDGDGNPAAPEPTEEANPAAPDGDGNPNPPEPAVDIDKLTRDELAQILSQQGIPFKSSASREHMINLYKEAIDK